MWRPSIQLRLPAFALKGERRRWISAKSCNALPQLSNLGNSKKYLPFIPRHEIKCQHILLPPLLQREPKAISEEEREREQQCKRESNGKGRVRESREEKAEEKAEAMEVAAGRVR